jgi:hypothetical protein
MALDITAQVEIAFRDADKADQRLDEFLVRDRLVRILHDLGNFTQEQRRGNIALVSALEFQPRRMYGEPIWDMYWQPLSSATDTAGKDHFFPDVATVDAEIIEQWCSRAQTTRHPLLRARYADLTWLGRSRGTARTSRDAATLPWRGAPSTATWMPSREPYSSTTSTPGTT